MGYQGVARKILPIVLIVVGYLVLPPIFFLVQSSLYSWEGFARGALSLSNFAKIFDFKLGELVSNTIIYGLGSSGLALVLGTLLAWLVERTNAPFKNAVYLASFIAFAIPGMVKTVGWILLLGPQAGLINTWARALLPLSGPLFNIFSLPGMMLIEGIIWTPVVFLLMATPFKSMDPSLEEVAAMSGANPWIAFRRITLRLAWPSLLSALLLSLIRATESFEVPALIGIPGGIRVFTTEIYLQMTTGYFPDYGVASAYGVLMLLLLLLLLYPYSRATRETSKFSTITGKGFRPRPISLGRWRYPAGVTCLLLPLFVLLPFLILLWASFTPYYMPPSLEAMKSLTLRNYPVALANTNVSVSFRNSFIVSIASATGIMLLTFVISWLLVRARSAHIWLLDQLASLPLVFPGVIAGLAILVTYLTIPVPIYGTVWLIVAGYMMRYLPYGMRYSHTGLLQIHKELEESAIASGASWFTTMRRVLLPLMAPALVSGWIYIFLITIREISTAILLYGPGSQVVAVTIFELYQNGQVTELSAFAIVLCAVVVAIAMLFRAASRRFGYTAQD